MQMVPPVSFFKYKDLHQYNSGHSGPNQDPEIPNKDPTKYHASSNNILKNYKIA